MFIKYEYRKSHIDQNKEIELPYAIDTLGTWIDIFFFVDLLLCCIRSFRKADKCTMSDGGALEVII